MQTCLWLLAVFFTQPLQASLNNNIHVVGSSTAYPIISVAAEHFGLTTRFNTPVVESFGTGGGIKLFCSGIGFSTPDIVMTSRRMKPIEKNLCEKNHVNDIREIKIGFDGIVIASSINSPKFKLSHRDIYLGLTRWISSSDGAEVILNPYKSWNEVNPTLPKQEIHVFGPPPTSGTRDILLERIFAKECKKEPALKKLLLEDENAFLQKCLSLREDGKYINAGENDNRVVRKLFNDPMALGVLGYNFLERNSDQLQAAIINDNLPDTESIETGNYSLSRPLYLYVKSEKLRIVPGLVEFVEMIISDDSIGPEGRLFDYGLIPLPSM